MTQSISDAISSLNALKIEQPKPYPMDKINAELAQLKSSFNKTSSILCISIIVAVGSAIVAPASIIFTAVVVACLIAKTHKIYKSIKAKKEEPTKIEKQIFFSQQANTYYMKATMIIALVGGKISDRECILMVNKNFPLLNTLFTINSKVKLQQAYDATLDIYKTAKAALEQLQAQA